MPVYEGVLQQMSGGGRVSQDTVVVDEDGWVVGRRRGDSRIRREFVEIGGKHIENVVLSPYHDALLQDSLGEEVALSAVGRRGAKQVVAVRTRRGLARPHFFKVLLMMIVAIFWFWLAAIVAAIFFFGGAALLEMDVLGTIGNIVIIFLLIWPFVHSVRVFRAWSALSEQPAHAAPAPAAVAAAVAPATPAAAMPPEGWYDDSERPGHKRWWDGTARGMRDAEHPSAQ